MPDRAVLLTEMIIDRPVCMACIDVRFGADAEESRSRIQKVLVIHRSTRPCRICGSVGDAICLFRPKAEPPISN